ncbi:MAG: DUF4886 domain-containing protein [Clostridiales bacterium]|nr:DUF4886 domain-containing protein [Clostridiales bacterium]
MKVLAIGNSFSQDAMRYLHSIAKAQDTELKTVNLFIGGCPLSRHYANMHNDDAQYEFEYNGERTGIRVSIRQALQSDTWDIVTLQQLSSQSPDYGTYKPYLGALAEYVKLHSPCARLMMHQTWAYEQGSARLGSELGYEKTTDMFKDIKAAYNKAAESLGNVGIIPSGELFNELFSAGAKHMYRDGFHASLGFGRLALGMLWYETLIKKPCADISSVELDEPVCAEDIVLVRECVHKALSKYWRKANV